MGGLQGSVRYCASHRPGRGERGESIMKPGVARYYPANGQTVIGWDGGKRIGVTKAPPVFSRTYVG